VKGDIVLEGAYLGCSICVSGVCLTVTELNPNTNRVFKAGLAPETLRRTYFSTLSPGDAVNLERASEIGGRNSGHAVQGHVDGVGTILDKWTDQDSLWIKIKVSSEILKYIVPKGFIAIDGTSLTVCEVDTRPDQSWFTFMLVEYTQKKIIIPAKPVGGLVNIEVDVLGKYAESALANVLPRIADLEKRVKELEKQLKL
jgi:riboflavin synthase